MMDAYMPFIPHHSRLIRPSIDGPRFATSHLKISNCAVPSTPDLPPFIENTWYMYTYGIPSLPSDSTGYRRTSPRHPRIQNHRPRSSLLLCSSTPLGRFQVRMYPPVRATPVRFNRLLNDPPLPTQRTKIINSAAPSTSNRLPA